MSFKWPKQRDVHIFYGDPDVDNNGQPDAKWEATNLTNFIPPYQMFWAWNNRPVNSIRVHKHCADAMYQALKNIGQAFSPAERSIYQLDMCGGAYNFRSMRGSHLLSMHSYGCAIDLAPQLNPLGKRWRPNERMMPKQAVEAFTALGATWGGDWDGDCDTLDQRRHDAMHFQFANL